MPVSETPAARLRRVLILGGTAEAAGLAQDLVERHGDWLAVTTSLAGRTRAPTPLSGAVRRGGFGGAAALAAYLTAQRVDAVIDATHPFAAQISANAAIACQTAGVPRLVLSRPGWSPLPGDDWIYVDSVDAAAAGLSRYGRRAFLTVGTQQLGAFAALADLWFLVRVIDMPTAPLPIAECHVVTGRGPFSVAAERTLMEAHRIDVLVTKASGGAATVAKLVAARRLALPVVMIRRPPPPPGPAVENRAAALDWIVACLGS